MRTKVFLRIFSVFLCVFFLSFEAKADFAKGIAAYDTGDYRTAFQEWGKAAEDGDLAAQRNLGHLYRWGKGVEKNAARAAYWYHRAAKVGFDRAQYNLAVLYFRGEGVPKDEVEAMRWLDRAARQGNKHAKIMLAKLQKGEKVSIPDAPVDSSIPSNSENDEITRSMNGEVKPGGSSILQPKTNANGHSKPAVKRKPTGDFPVPPQFANKNNPLSVAAKATHQEEKTATPKENPQKIVTVKTQEKPLNTPAVKTGHKKLTATEIMLPEKEKVVVPVEDYVTEAPAVKKQPETKKIVLTEKAPEKPKTKEPEKKKPVKKPPVMAKPVEVAVVPVKVVPSRKPDAPVKKAPKKKPVLKKPAVKKSGKRLMAHLGSYKTLKSSKLGWDFLKDNYKKHSLFERRVDIVKIPNKGTFHRLYAVGDAKDVRNLCDAFIKIKSYCAIYNEKGNKVH